jgi:rhodanese-related sulfurtransferase
MSMVVTRVLSLAVAAGLAVVLAPTALEVRASSPAAIAAPVAAGTLVDAAAVARRLKRKQRVVFVDTRDYVDGETVAGAVVVPAVAIEAWAQRARKTDYIVAFCTCEDDGLAIQAADTLRRLGFKNAWALHGGLEAARSAGIPMGAAAQ